MAAVMTVCRDDLELPPVEPVELFLYENKASMAWYGRSWKTLPIDVEGFAAFADGNKIHINLDGASPNSWGNFIKLLAHEYGHSIEARLRTRNGYSWFTEGFASWVSAKVLHSLGWEDYGLMLERAKFEVINSRPLPSLSELTWDWKVLRQAPRGYVKTYVVAFVAVDRLIERSGFAAILKYIESGHFEKSFQLSWEDFQTDFDRYLSNLAQTQHAGPIVLQKPQWRLGDEWTYQVKRAGGEPVELNRVVREDEFNGKASYVVRANGLELFVAKETLARLAAMEDGKIIAKYDSFQQFSWPLTVGKRWRGEFERENVATKKKKKIDLMMIVAEAKDVSVPAGTFKTVRIQAYDSKSGRLMLEYWYAPETKWTVKSREYFEVPSRQKELKSFRVAHDTK